ncbi:MAG TPA: GntR family transcriptional regulator [Anaerolineae bacterium]|nr:GntR family transcriptional regulator [Anaerolineae bacterium]
MAELIYTNTPIPLYYQLQEILRDKIENGVWKSGERLPTEKELCKQFDVSRITVRNALRQLRMEGLINCMPGKGTTVSQSKVREFVLTSVSGSYSGLDPKSKNCDFSTKVLESTIIKSPAKARIILKLKTGEKVTKLVRVRYTKEEPLFWSTAYVPYKICPNFINNDFETRSFFEILEHEYGISPDYTVRTIETVLATNRDTNYLGVVPGTPINIMESVCFLKDGAPFEFSRSYYRGDRIKFIVSLHKSDQDIDLLKVITQEHLAGK